MKFVTLLLLSTFLPNVVHYSRMECGFYLSLYTSFFRNSVLDRNFQFYFSKWEGKKDSQIGFSLGTIEYNVCDLQSEDSICKGDWGTRLQENPQLILQLVVMIQLTSRRILRD